MRLNVTQAIMIIGFACVCTSTLYVGHAIKTELILIYKQIDSQPKRIVDEFNLPSASPPPAERPALNDLPPEIIQRIIQKH